MWVPGTVTSNPFRKFFSGPQVVCSLAYTDQHPSEEPMGTFYSFSEFILCINLSHLIFYLATSRNLLSWTLALSPQSREFTKFCLTPPPWTTIQIYKVLIQCNYMDLIYLFSFRGELMSNALKTIVSYTSHILFVCFRSEAKSSTNYYILVKCVTSSCFLNWKYGYFRYVGVRKNC